MLTCITTETSNCWSIPNQQNHDVVGNEEALERMFLANYDAQIRTKATGHYNCHGLTFASRRTCIDEASSISRILHDDCYRLVENAGVIPGDVVLYYDVDGTVSHSGIVIEVSDILPRFVRVVSKWGTAGAEYLHWVHRSPYGTDYRFYRVDHSTESMVLSKIILGTS